MIGEGTQTAENYTVEKFVFFAVAETVISCLRGIVWLGVLGLGWPHPSQDAAASQMTHACLAGVRAYGNSYRL